MKPRNGGETVPIDVKFERSVELVRSLPSDGPVQLSYSSAAKVYSYFKQAKFGSCKDLKPNFWDVIKKAKWEAWTKLGDMPKETAMELYVEAIKEQFKEFIKQTDFTDEDDCDFSETVVSFCYAVDLPCPKQLEKYSMQNNHTNEDGNSNSKVNGTAAVLVNGNNKIDMLKAKANKNKSTVSKEVDFDDIKKESGDESGDDVYCDSIDPGEASNLFPAHVNGSSRGSEPMVNLAMLTENNSSHAGCQDITNVDSLNGEDPSNNRRKLKSSSRNHQFSNGKQGIGNLPVKHNGIGRQRPSSERGTHRKHNQRSSLPDAAASEDVECDSDAMADALRNFDSSGGSGKYPSDDTDSECSAAYSLTDDRILIALKRLQRDIHVVSERIAAIEYSMCQHKHHTGSWVDFNGPSSKTVLFFLAWPVLVNVLFFYWRKRKQRSG